jgi:large subunit ribosomal protein L23
MATKKITSSENKGAVSATAKLILSPRVTEKASMQSSANAYTFVVAKNATKLDILAEFKKEYKVTPKAINITNMPRRNTFIRGKIGTQAGIKKAIVFLKKGDTITLA